MSLHAKAVGMLAVRRRERFTSTTKITTVRSPPPTPCCKKVSRAQKKKSIGCNSHCRRALRSPTEQRGSKGPRHVAALGSAVVTELPVQDGSCDGVLLVTMAENNSVKRDPQGAPTLTRGRGITRITESRFLPPPGSLELAQSNAGASGNSNRTTTVETRSNRSKRRTRNNNNSVKSVAEASAQSPSSDIVDNSDVISEQRPAAEGSSHSDQEQENSEHDPETEELARLRCPSERTEVIAERETRRRQRRCADYPGFAFGSSIFGSDTLMKFNIIRNELQNIKNSQLKRQFINSWGKAGFIYQPTQEFVKKCLFH